MNGQQGVDKTVQRRSRRVAIREGKITVNQSLTGTNDRHTISPSTPKIGSSPRLPEGTQPHYTNATRNHVDQKSDLH